MQTVTKTEIAVVSRKPLEGAPEAYSGATLERVELANGQHVVMKHLPAEGDWLTRASGGTDHLRRLWESGLLARVGSAVDHTVLDVVRVDGHDVVVMRDASAELLPARVAVSRRDSRRLLAWLAALHETATNEPVQPLCPIGARYSMFAPALHAADRGPGSHPAAARIVEGWELFADRVDTDVVDTVFAVHRNADALGRRLGRFEPTVLHGDVKLENLGFNRSGLVAVDWGDLSGFGPVEIDVGWYALMNTRRIGGAPGHVFADYEAAAGRPLDREALDLVCVGSLAQMGFRLAAGASLGEPATRAAAAAQLAWWTTRVREALDRVGSL